MSELPVNPHQPTLEERKTYFLFGRCCFNHLVVFQNQLLC